MTSRLLYDNCAGQEYLNRNKQYRDYLFYGGKYYHNNPCRIGFGVVGGNNVSLYTGNLVNLESDLRGITRPLSLCNKHGYNPYCGCPSCRSCTDTGIPCGCLQCTSRNMQNLPTCWLTDYSRDRYLPRQRFGGPAC